MTTPTLRIFDEDAEASVPESPLSPAEGTRLRDYLQIIKPRIAVMVLVTVIVGFVLGCGGEWRWVPLLHACLGILMAATASNAFNQYLERETDRRMERTADRPLPSGRIRPAEVLTVAVVLTVVSTIYLAVLVNVATALATLATILSYAWIYTPLKRVTPLCTAVGAIPGALPPVLGWLAAGQPLNLTAFGLFGILFLWQFPHFLAIAWLHRQQYEAAGLKMLPGRGRPGVVGLLSVGYAVLLVPISLLPSVVGLSGELYALVAVGLGLGYLATAVLFWLDESRQSARRVLFVSLFYLPGLLLTLTADHLRLLA